MHGINQNHLLVKLDKDDNLNYQVRSFNIVENTSLIGFPYGESDIIVDDFMAKSFNLSNIIDIPSVFRNQYISLNNLELLCSFEEIKLNDLLVIESYPICYSKSSRTVFDWKPILSIMKVIKKNPASINCINLVSAGPRSFNSNEFIRYLDFFNRTFYRLTTL